MVLLVALIAGAATQTEPESGLPPAVEYQGDLFMYCDEHGNATDVEPHTPEAIAAAQSKCQRLDHAIDNAPWPEGIHP